jgi:hypothetical protein
MNIYITNVSTVLTDAQVKGWFPALRIYSHHIRSYWRSAEEVLIFGKPPTPVAWQIIVADDSDQAGALGYHDYAPGGRPYGYVFAKTDLDAGYSVTVTLSHEVAEMIMDPYVQRSEQTGNLRFHALELGDPVEADELGYEIDGVLVSDFITPAWFVPGHPGPIFDHRRHCSAPLQVLPGGYAYIWDPTTGWQGFDHAGKARRPRELPDRTRLQRYARDRGRR